nr:polysaccharide lyase family 8 super-sandwich domain-containing protein [uncultured Pedobacter sp.]
MKRFFCVLLLAVMASSFAKADDLDIIYQRLFDDYLAKNTLKSQAIIQGYMDTQQSDGSWSDINYDYHDAIGAWLPGNHWIQLLSMAVAYQKSNSTFYKNTILKEKIRKGILYWTNRSPQPYSDNWFSNIIGTQWTIRQVLILMRDDFSGTDLTSAIYNVSDKYLILPSDFYTSSRYDATNAVWVAGNFLNGAVLKKDTTKLKTAISIMAQTLAVENADQVGIQADNSFQFHGPLIYNGGYGLSLMTDVSYYMYQVRGLSVVGFTTAQINVLSNLLLNGDQWMVLGKTYDFHVVGREISRTGKTTTNSLKVILTQMKEINPTKTSDYQTIINNISDETGGTNGVTGNRYFYRSDYMIQKKGSMLIGIRMNSNRTISTESINGENKLGNWLGLGSTCIMHTGTDYFNIYPVWDWTKIPGVTNPEVKIDWTTPQSNNRQTLPTAGGVSDGHNGVVGMSLNKVTNNNGISVDIKAKKANFLWNNEMICLGADIQSNYANAPVTTTINQTYLKSFPIVNGTALTSFGESTYNNAGWVYHDSIGYVIRNGANFKLKEDYQSGNWVDINAGMKNEVLNQRIFKLWIDHGVKPISASYDYAVLPNYSEQRTSNYAANPTSETISNTGNLQAVTQKVLYQTGAVFYTSGTLTISPSLKVTVDKPSVLLIDWSTSPIKITASDLNQDQTTLQVTITYSDLANEVLTYNLPQGNLKGSSVTQTAAHALMLPGRSSWSSSSGANFDWPYVLDGSLSNQSVGTVFPVLPDYNPNYSNTTSSSSGFMPTPISGIVKVYANLDGGGSFKLVESGADDKLKMTASKTTAVDKFSVYGIPEGTDLTAFYVTLNFENNAATGSNWGLALGNQDPSPTAPANKFNNGSGVPTGGATPEVFAFFRFDISATDATKMSVSYGGLNSSSAPANISLGNLINRGEDNRFEFLCNNTTGAKTYKRGGVTYTIASGTYQVWLNDVLLSLSADNYDFPAIQLTRGMSVNSIVIQGVNNKTGALASNDGSIVISKLSMQSPSSASALPVSLVAFAAKASLGKIDLSWQTTAESNNSHFDVLRLAPDSSEPVKIVGIAGKGNSNSLIYYSATDNFPLTGLNYYQLSQVDNDGKASLSKVIGVRSKFNTDDFVIYQDNAHYVTASVTSAGNSTASFRLVNMEGRVVNEFNKTLAMGNNNIRLCDYLLPKGVYLAILNIDGKQNVKKIEVY